jgi:hypothetical protein
MTTFSEWFDKTYDHDSAESDLLCRITAEQAWNKAISVATEEVGKAIFVNSATQTLHAIVHAEIEAYRNGKTSHPADSPEEIAKQAVKIGKSFGNAVMAFLDGSDR